MTEPGRPQRVLIVGQGYVGLPVAVRAAEAGHTVVGFDTGEERVKLLAAGDSYVEDVPSERLRCALAAGCTPTSDPGDCVGFDVAAMSDPIPSRRACRTPSTSRARPGSARRSSRRVRASSSSRRRTRARPTSWSGRSSRRDPGC